MPLCILELVFPQFHVPFPGDGIKCYTIIEGEFEHIICRVPASRDVPWHDAFTEFEFIEEGIPSGKDQC